MYCVRGMDDRFKGYHLCETYLMQPSILPEDYFAYVFTNALDRPRSLRVPSACFCVLAQPRVCTPSALHHCLCWSDEIGYNDAMAGGKLYTVSWLSCVYRALEEHQSLLSVEPSMLPCFSAVDSMDFLAGSSDRRRLGKSSLHSLAAYHVHACQYVSGKAVGCWSRMVQTGCGDVGVES
jgi:hypothetical protein